MKITTITAFATFTTLFAFAGEAQAAGESQATPFEPTYADRVSEFPWESNYFPSSGPLRVKLGAAAWQDIEIAMTGDAEYAWDQGLMGVRGETDGGYFLNTIGAEITVTVAYDILGFAGEFEIGVYEITEDFTQNFTPYVLDGNADRPVETAFELGPYNLVDEPFAIGSGTGNFTLDFRIDSPGVTFTGTHVDLVTEAGSTGPQAQITAENVDVSLDMPGQPGERVEVIGTEYGTISSEVSMHLMPTVSLNMFGLDFTIGPFDIEMAYPIIDQSEVRFDDYVMQFDVPEAPEEPSDDDGSDDDGDDSGDPEPSDDDGSDDNADDGSDDGSDDGEEPSDDGEEPMEPEGDSAGESELLEGDGCGCTSGNAPNGLAFGLVVLGLLGLRRRRD